MLHPSYSDLMNVVNGDVEEGEQPVVQSRYSIVIATAKRARQIISGEEALIDDARGKKPLSIAVEELYQGKVKIMGADDDLEGDEDLGMDYNSDMLDVALDDEEAKIFDGEENTEA